MLGSFARCYDIVIIVLLSGSIVSRYLVINRHSILFILHISHHSPTRLHTTNTP